MKDFVLARLTGECENTPCYFNQGIKIAHPADFVALIQITQNPHTIVDRNIRIIRYNAI